MIDRLKRWLPWLKILLGVGLLLVVIIQVDWGDLVGYLLDVDPAWMILGLAVVLVGLLVKAVRWGVLLHSFNVKVAPSKVLEAYLTGQALNILLPARGGEFARFGLVSADKPQLSPEIASSIVMEKSLDVLGLGALVGFLLLALPANTGTDALGTILPRLGGLFIGLIVLIFVFVMVWPVIYSRLRGNLKGWPDRLIEAFQRGVTIWLLWIRQPKKTIPAVALTLVNWILMWITNLVIFRAVGLAAGGVAAALVLALVMIGLLPAWMPGNIAPFYFFATLGLLPFNIPLDLGLAFAVVLHAVVTLPTLLIGGVILLLPGRRSRLNDA
jgi:uncharacterized membrane protein YbhN (UPF0104 family)